MKPCEAKDPATCMRISELLGLIGDKWSLLVVRTLGGGPLRFNALRREVGDISQKMLAVTLRNLERNGFVSRTVTPTAPPQVDYALTGLGHDLLTPVCGLASWVRDNGQRIEAARQGYDARREAQNGNGVSTDRDPMRDSA